MCTARTQYESYRGKITITMHHSCHPYILTESTNSMIIQLSTMSSGIIIILRGNYMHAADMEPQRNAHGTIIKYETIAMTFSTLCIYVCSNTLPYMAITVLYYITRCIQLSWCHLHYTWKMHCTLDYYYST